MLDQTRPTWMDEDHTVSQIELDDYDGPRCERCEAEGQLFGVKQLTDNHELVPVKLDLGEVWLYECGSNPCEVLCVGCAEEKRDRR